MTNMPPLRRFAPFLRSNHSLRFPRHPNLPIFSMLSEVISGEPVELRVVSDSPRRAGPGVIPWPVPDRSSTAAHRGVSLLGQMSIRIREGGHRQAARSHDRWASCLASRREGSLPWVPRGSGLTGPIRPGAGNSIHRSCSRADLLLSATLPSYLAPYTPSDLYVTNPITNQRIPISTRDLMQHNNPNSPLLSNQGKIVSGTDRAGDQWTITVHGPARSSSPTRRPTTASRRRYHHHPDHRLQPPYDVCDRNRDASNAVLTAAR